MKRLIPFILLISLFCSFGTGVSAQGNAQPDSIELKLREAYTKREVMIPMRDGVKLYTAIYEPKDNSKRHPIPFLCAITMWPQNGWRFPSPSPIS